MIKKLLMLALALASATAVSAGGHKKSFAKEHPRRAEVVHREKKENDKVNKAMTEKKITYQQGHKIQKEERKIRQEERADAAKHGGHITKAEKRELNKEEHKVEMQEKRMEKRDAEKAEEKKN